MFTGLVEGVGRVKTIERIHNDMQLTITPPAGFSGWRIGDSISVDGVCLTISALRGVAFSMDVSGETLSRSTLALLKPGDEVNLERALRFSDRLGGHLVSGHVDGTGRIVKKERRQRSWLLRVEIDRFLSRYTLEKGSIAVDGISLTINRCEERFFEANIIPQTGKETGLLKKRVGDLVNIETDLIGKYVEKFLKSDSHEQKDKPQSHVNLEMLLSQGFGD